MSVSARNVRLLLVAVILLFPPEAVEDSLRPVPTARAEEQPSTAGPDMERRIEDLEAQVRELSAALQALRKSSRAVEPGRLEELEKQIDVLTREIERLKLGEGKLPEAAPPVHGLGPAASKIYQVRQGVSIGGYGELTYQDFDRQMDDGSPSGRTDTLDLARVVLYFGYKWNDHVLFNSELEFEHATTGEGVEEKGEVSVEFAYLDFLVRNGLSVRAGLLLIPVGFLNELHEPTTFPGVLRPEVERLILPSTWRENGAGVFGEAGKFSYRAYLVAGLDALGFSGRDGLREGRQGGSQSAAEDLAFSLRADLSGIPSLLAGISYYSGNSGQGRIDAGARVTLMDVHLQYQWRGLEVRALWTQANVEDTVAIGQAQGLAAGSPDLVGSNLRGWYGQAAWDLLSLGEGFRASLAPFARYETLDTQHRVSFPYVRDPASERRILTLGLCWKPLPQVAVKAEFQDVSNGAGTGVDQINLGLGWIF